MIGKKYIWIVCEYDQYDSASSLQLIQKARELKDKKNAEIWVVCIGSYKEDEFEVIHEYGVSDILFEQLDEYDTEQFTNILERMITEFDPELVIFSDSNSAKTVSAKISNKFDVGLTADCIDIYVDDEAEYVFSRTAINDSVVANIKCINSKFQMCTVKNNLFKAIKSKAEYDLKVHRLSEQIESQRKNNHISIISRKDNEKERSFDIDNVKIVFSVGRGIRDRETFERIRKLASEWKAEIVGTRAAVEEGWIDSSRQIGQSGVSIAPDLYIGFGVSGAIQHMIGLKNAKTIVAINNDESAPIFNYADFCIVEDINEVIEEMNNKKIIEKSIFLRS